MTNEMQVENIQGIECYEQDSVAYLKLDAVARGLDITKTDKRNGTEYKRINRQNLQKWLYSFGILNSENDELPDFIPENIFYRLAMKAKNETAEKFQAKVADEIIPSIRKHGAYMTEETLEKALTSPDFLIQLATRLKEEQDKNKALKADNQRMKPKEIFADAVATSYTSILIGDLAKLVKQNGVDIGQKRMFAWMRDNGYLIKRNGSDWNMPTQKSMELGLFEVKESTINNPDGTVRITRTTKVTGKGQQYFINKFLSQSQEG